MQPFITVQCLLMVLPCYEGFKPAARRSVLSFQQHFPWLFSLSPALGSSRACLQTSSDLLAGCSLILTDDVTWKWFCEGIWLLYQWLHSSHTQTAGGMFTDVILSRTLMFPQAQQAFGAIHQCRTVMCNVDFLWCIKPTNNTYHVTYNQPA